MKLSIHDRIQIQNFLPREGDYITLCLRDDIIKKTGLSQEEIKQYEITSNEGTISWNVEKAKEKDIDYSESELNLIKKTLKELDEKKKLTEGTFPVYKLFFDNK